MVVLIVLVTVIVFAVVDLLLRLIMKRVRESKRRDEREKALEVGLRLDYTDEAPSLKRVEVENPRARILAVDDEGIVLDSFRKILVIGGFSVDTVETGKEALGLVRKNEYDFVFTDFKMPEMDGVEVTKAVKHLRPDIDVIMITGYASIESAVETMKFGAMDYVEKPFTTDELNEMVGKFVIRREARLEKEIKPAVRLVTPSVGESESRHEFNVPAGVFVSESHSWVAIRMNGLVRVGIDDFTQKSIGKIDGVDLPDEDQKIKRGETLFALRQGDRRLSVPSPIEGKIAEVNVELLDRPEMIMLKPYELGWICSMEPTNLTDDMQKLRLGADAVGWYRDEVDKYASVIKKAIKEKDAGGAPPHGSDDEDGDQLDQMIWEMFSQTFINR